MGYQSHYQDYAKYPVKDANMGYAVHVYAGWYAQSDETADGDRVFFKVFGNFNNWQDYAQIGWSEDGQTWQMAQQKVPMRFDTGKFFMGAKFALFNYATKEVGGLADFDYFRIDAPLHEVR